MIKTRVGKKKKCQEEQAGAGLWTLLYIGPEGTQPSPADTFQVFLQNHLSSDKITGGLPENGE